MPGDGAVGGSRLTYTGIIRLILEYVTYFHIMQVVEEGEGVGRCVCLNRWGGGRRPYTSRGPGSDRWDGKIGLEGGGGDPGAGGGGEAGKEGDERGRKGREG